MSQHVSGTTEEQDDTKLYTPGDPSSSASEIEVDLKLYIFVLKSLKPGKAVSQAGHAVHLIVDELATAYTTECYETMTGKLPESIQRYRRWCSKPTKVALSATDDQLLKLASMPEATSIVDVEGDLNVRPGTLVCVAFRPRSSASFARITAHHKLH